MKHLLAGITLAAFVCVSAVQAGEGKDCQTECAKAAKIAKAKACESKCETKAACCPKTVKVAQSPKGAQQTVKLAKR